MPRLSIVIPCSQFDGRVEDTLVSVLQNRPVGCEVIVVTAGEYDDPYELSDEVVFVTESSTASLLRLVNRGVQAADADVVHVILPGNIAADGWTDDVLSHFADSRVAAVSPMMPGSSGNHLTAALGVQYRVFGARRVMRRGIRLTSDSVRRAAILGPTLEAGFYRREVLQALAGFDEEAGESYADVDLGLALRELDYTARVEPNCQIILKRPRESSVSVFQRARQSEVTYRKYAPRGAMCVAMHGLFAMVHALAKLLPHRVVACFAGRLAGCFESGVFQKHTERMSRAREFLHAQSESQRASVIRMDATRRTPRTRQTASAAPRRRAA